MPFNDWLSTVADSIAVKKIHARLLRLHSGNFGVHKRLSEHLYELIITRSPGYRIYYCELDPGVVVILHGGTKRTQPTDIEKAWSYIEEIIGGHP